MMRLRPSSVALAALSLLSSFAALAAALDGCALPGFVLDDRPDAGPDVITVAEAGPATCMSATYPDPPGGTDSPTSISLVVAVHTLDLGDNGTTPGFDLDHTCTCFDDAGSTCVGQSPQLSAYCDAPGGVDNQAAKLFQLIEVPVGKGNFGSDYFSAEANAGAWSLLIKVDGYNGMPDDPDVQVAIYPSKGLGKTPTWQGDDAWPVTPASFNDAGAPSFASNGAYVSGSVLVATLPTSQVTLAGSGLDTITIQLSAGVLTGKLVQSGALWSIQGGVIAARWALADVFRALSTYRDNKGAPFCSGQGAYDYAKGVICGDADILVDGTQPKSAPCDALSIGLGYTADPALLGAVSDAGLESDGCPAGTDPATDSCSK